MNNNRCVVCGAVIPEGSQVCISCCSVLEKSIDTARNTVKEVLDVVVSALEKQIPKKPIILGYREGREVNTISYTCPICHKHISRDNFCKNCGQALDWSNS